MMTDSTPYDRAEQYMVRLEAVMHEVGLWPGDKPEGPLEVKGAFGCENMTYPQWLAWVLIPRVRQIIADRSPFPAASQTAAYCIRGLDAVPGGGDVHDVLSEFDAMIEALSSSPQ